MNQGAPRLIWGRLLHVETTVKLKFPLFVDPRYNAEQDVEFDSAEVETLEETTRTLFFGGSHKITLVTLRNGRQHTLNGHHRLEIERAKPH